MIKWTNSTHNLEQLQQCNQLIIDFGARFWKKELKKNQKIIEILNLIIIAHKCLHSKHSVQISTTFSLSLTLFPLYTAIVSIKFNGDEGKI